MQPNTVGFCHSKEIVLKPDTSVATTLFSCRI